MKTAGSDVLSSLLSYLFCLLLLISLHEAGHALVARLVGLRVYRIALGYGRRLFKFRLGKVRVDCNLLPFGGATYLAPRQTTGIRWRMWLATAAGPAVHVVLAVVFYHLTRDEQFRDLLFATSGPWAADMLENLVTFNLLLLVANALPYHSNDPTGVAATDGYQLARIPFLKDKELEYYVAAEFIYQAEEQRKAGWTEQAIAVLEDARRAFPENNSLRLHLAHQRLRGGEIEWARAEYAALLEADKLDPTPRRRLILFNYIAYADALLNKPELLAEADVYSAEALRMEPMRTTLIGTRGTVLLRLGRVDEGCALPKRAYQRAFDAESRAMAACWLALGAAQRGAHNEAADWLQKAHDSAPGHYLVQQITEELRDSHARPLAVTPPRAAAETGAVAFTLTSTDYLAFAAQQFRRSWFLWFVSWGLLFLAVVFLPGGLFQHWPWELAYLFRILSFFALNFVRGLAYEVLSYWLARLKARARLRDDQLSRQSVTLSPAGVRRRQAGREQLWDWQELPRLELGAEHIFFHTGQDACLIPLRAFDSLFAAGSFSQLALGYWRQAHPQKSAAEIKPQPLLAGYVRRLPLAATAALVALVSLLASLYPAFALAAPAQ